MNIALVHPEIPGNTGNIARSCVALDIMLHLVHPLGFRIDDRHLRRAGLDYWKDLNLVEHGSLETFLDSECMRGDFYCFSRFAKKEISDVHFSDSASLIFGSETQGLPNLFAEKFPDRMVRIPTTGPVRSLNLSTAAGIAAFEAIRQSRLSS